MKKKGFTLVELLAVIVILSILILVGAPTLINNLNEKKQEASNKVEELIISAARSYVIDYNLEEPLSLPIESFCEYIDCPIIDPYTNEEINGYVIADEERNYSIVKGKVGFNVVLNGGSNGQTFETEYPAYTTLTIVEPIKVGYEFSHWEVTKGNGIVDGNKVTIGSTDTEIYAMWKANPGLVIDYDGGTVSNPDLATSYKTGTSIDLVPSTKEGYTFSHWEIIEGNSTRSGNVITIGTENTVVKAIWTSNTYTINYYIGNGTDTEGVTKLGTSTCKYNESCTLKGFADLGGIFPYSKEDNETNGKKNFNWTFYGWGETQTTTTRKYANSASFTYDKTSNINLYAVGYKRFYFYGGVAPTTYLSSLYQYWNPYSTSASYLTSIKIPTATTIDGWTFAGYRTGSNLASWGESTTEAQYATSGVATFPSAVVGTTLKPAYTSYQTARGVYKRTVKLQFASNGGTGTIAAQEKTQYYNTGYSSSGANVSANVSTLTFTLPTSGFTKSYYTLNKWAAGSTSGTQYATGASYTGFKPEVTDTVTSQTMYAIWKVNSVYINYHVNGGTITSQTQNADATSTYNWTTSSSIIYRNGTKETTTINYGASKDPNNYNNKNYINITRTGYTTTSGAEWICHSGCTTANKTFGQGTTYNATDFCDPKNGNCTVVLKVNWKQNTPVGSYTCANTSAGSGTKMLTYTGNCTMLDDGNGNWRVKFLTSGTLKLASSIKIDTFLVGGGGAAGTYYSGGGGGYTKTQKAITLNANTNYDITIGNGATTINNTCNNLEAGSTTAFNLSAAGGYSGGYTGYNAGCGGNGGSGGGANRPGAINGTNSSAGKGGIGQGFTTREFGEYNGTLYSTGGSGAADANGAANTGNGGSRYESGTGKGGSGVVVIRNARTIVDKPIIINNTTIGTYTGEFDIEIEDNNNWKVKFLSSGDLKLNSALNVDVFLVGGGGAGIRYHYNYSRGGGGGGGYTLTKKNITLNKNTTYGIVVGLGGIADATNGNPSSAFGYVAAGGYIGGEGSGGNGGSGGGGTANDGASGGNDSSGKGQISTPGPNGESGNTREFGETSGKLYAGGGGGGGYTHSTSGVVSEGGNGGAGGGGEGFKYSKTAAFDGLPNTGGGGGGTGVYETDCGSGGSGIVIIRNKR